MRKISLYDYLEHCETGIEIPVEDKIYSISIYFHGNIEIDESNSIFKKYIVELTKLLTVEKICAKGIIVVNLSDIIENHIKQIKESDLFVNGDCDTDSIMDMIHSIVSGYTPEEWFVKFIEILKQ